MPTSDAIVAAQWDVVVLPFPYADRLAEKRRPAIVISRPQLAEQFGIVWVAMVTSAANAGWTDDVPIPDFSSVGLTSASVVRVAKIAAVDMARILRVAGRLDDRTIVAIQHQVLHILGYAPE